MNQPHPGQYAAYQVPQYPQPAPVAVPPPAAQVPQAPPVPPPPPRIILRQGDPLYELIGQLEAAKAAEAEAVARAKAINAAIKNLVTAQYPGQGVIDIIGNPVIPSMKMTWVTPRKLDTERLKTEQLDTYNRYLVWGNGYWQLKKAGAGR